MFNSAEAASQSSGGMVSSDYIQNLEEDITSLNELINKTKTDSDAKVTKLQNEIDSLKQELNCHMYYQEGENENENNIKDNDIHQIDERCEFQNNNK